MTVIRRVQNIVNQSPLCPRGLKTRYLAIIPLERLCRMLCSHQLISPSLFLHLVITGTPPGYLSLNSLNYDMLQHTGNVGLDSGYLRTYSTLYALYQVHEVSKGGSEIQSCLVYVHNRINPVSAHIVFDTYHLFLLEYTKTTIYVYL